MNAYDWGAVITAALGFIAWGIATEVRLRNVQSQLRLADQKNADAATVASVHALPDNELDADLRIELARGPNKTTN